jgi:glycine cleavage system H protein
MSHKIPQELKYTKDHEWALIEGDIVTIGITDFAQSSLGDVVFVELPAMESSIAREQAFGVVESIKSVSDLYAPISGLVVERNEDVINTPGLLNEDCYLNWLIKVKLKSPSELDKLLDAQSYKNICQ